MAKIGTVLEGKYEILKEIGQGGMSTVYLANDTHLNRNWAVKEVKKQGNGENDQIIVNSLLAEANLVKRLDHPALPRIVDIIDKGGTIYIVMDFIEGESLDKILAANGPQPESKVIAWAMQVCDVFTYLHSQTPPIIYRDMKPSNLMLKPNGNISIIDFGIAREYKERGISDTTVLGTRGYAPPEQYSGQTDPRSDIFALGMTMHHLLTGADPRNGEPYVRARALNPDLTVAIEYIIDRCVQPASENRYQSAAELMVDLDVALRDPDAFTKKRQRQLKAKRASFFTAVGFAALALVTGVVLNVFSTKIKNTDYDRLISESQVGESKLEDYYEAIELYPGRTDAYMKVIDYCRDMDYEQMTSAETDAAIVKIGESIRSHANALNASDARTAELNLEMGKLYLAYYYGTNGSFKTKAKCAKDFFESAAAFTGEFDNGSAASCYSLICSFITAQKKTYEHTKADYEALFRSIEGAMEVVGKAKDGEANYDKLTFYYSVLMLVRDQSLYMAGVGYDESDALRIMESVYDGAVALTPSEEETISLQNKIAASYEPFVETVTDNYIEVAKRSGGGV